MLVELVNTPRPYAWGDRFSIAGWQSRPATQQPEAELWLGTHKGSESSVVRSEARKQLLSDFLTEQGLAPDLPFLVKVLAAAKPLSIQVHPNKKQAQSGYLEEQQAGVELSNLHRNYKDRSDKPEVIIAWSDQFEALAGFQDRQGMEETLSAVVALVGSSRATQSLRAALDDGCEGVIEWLLAQEAESRTLAHDMTQAFLQGSRAKGSEPVWNTWASVIPCFPEDPGIVVASFLNYVSLRKGEALFIPAGIAHAYLKGFGLEVMAPSDNVVRGGLTDKHVDREELARLVVREPYSPARIASRDCGDSSESFEVPGVPFSIRRLTGRNTTSDCDPSGPVVIVIHEGMAELAWNDNAQSLVSGRSYLWVPKKDTPFTLQVDGSAYIVGPS